MSAEPPPASAARPLAPEEVDVVADAIASGFHDNEIWAWMIPDARRRARALPAAYRALIRRVYLSRGEAWTTSGAEGGALWMPPGEPKRRPLEGLAEAATLAPRIGLRGLWRGARIDGLTHRHHPDEPHWYLEVLSVAPEHQRRGIGSALLRPTLERCDAEEMPAYLETQREANLPYYGRFGFELTERIALPDSPPLWLMWREPGSGAGAGAPGG